MGDVVVDKFLKSLMASMKVDGQKAQKRSDPETLERNRIRTEISNLRIDQRNSFPTLDIRPLVLLIKQGASIGNISDGGDLITIDVNWPDGTTSQLFQEIGARDGETYAHSNSRHRDDATYRVKQIGKRERFVKTTVSSEEIFNKRGVIIARETNDVRDEFKNGRLISSVDLGTGLRSYYYDGTDRVAFVVSPAGQVVAEYDFDADKRFEVQLQPTNFLLVHNCRKMKVRPRFGRKRLSAYKKKIRTHVKAPHVSGEFADPTDVEKLQKVRQVIMVAGVVSVSNAKPLGSLQGMFGLSEGLVAAFLRSGPVYGGSVVRASSKSTVVASTTEAVRTSDDAASMLGSAFGPMIVMSKGAFLAMANTQTDSSDTAREGRSVRRDGKDSAKPAIKVQGSLLHASHKPEVSRVGAPVMMARGSVPTLRGERYIVSRRPAIDIKMTSGTGKQSPLFRGSVLSATPSNQWVVPAALPTINNVARVDAKISVKDAMRQPLVMKTGRGSRDSESGSNPHQGNDDQPKKRQPKQADS